jgi:hypothetical protein
MRSFYHKKTVKSRGILAKTKRISKRPSYFRGMGMSDMKSNSKPGIVQAAVLFMPRVACRSDPVEETGKVER